MCMYLYVYIYIYMYIYIYIIYYPHPDICSGFVPVSLHSSQMSLRQALRLLAQHRVKDPSLWLCGFLVGYPFS